MSLNLVDPSFELIDPCPDIHALFLQYNRMFFQSALSGCEVKWSPRMYSCAGVCSYECRSGMCSIRLSKPLLTLRPRKDLVETLLHEMIHAFLFVKRSNQDRDGHGPEFQYHMHRINQKAGTRITIYHTFHDEVKLYKKHWWRCNGTCRNTGPFYGWVKRTCNRAPGPNDLWWASHQQKCSGKFVKEKEPEGFGEKKKKTEKGDKAASKKTQTSPPNNLDTYFKKIGAGTSVVSQKSPSKSPSKSSGTSIAKPFTGSGAALGGGGNGRSRLLDSLDGGVNKMGSQTSGLVGAKLGGAASTSRLLGDAKENGRKRTHSVPGTGSQGNRMDTTMDKWMHKDDKPNNSEDLKNQTSGDSKAGILKREDDTRRVEVITIDDDVEEISFLEMIVCPSCNEEVLMEYLNDHLDHCAG